MSFNLCLYRLFRLRDSYFLNHLCFEHIEDNAASQDSSFGKFIRVFSVVYLIRIPISLQDSQ
jgi:hypothetical protein